MTTKDILKEHLSSLNFPEAAWDELAEKIDKNSVTVTDNEINEFSKQKFMLGDDELPHTVAEVFCIKRGATWMRYKMNRPTPEKPPNTDPWRCDACENSVYNCKCN